MRLCISIASILLVTTPVVAAVITVREQTPDRPIVVVVEGSLAAFDEDQFAAQSHTSQSRLAAYFADIRMVASTLIQAYDAVISNMGFVILGDFTVDRHE